MATIKRVFNLKMSTGELLQKSKNLPTKLLSNITSSKANIIAEKIGMAGLGVHNKLGNTLNPEINDEFNNLTNKRPFTKMHVNGRLFLRRRWNEWALQKKTY